MLLSIDTSAGTGVAIVDREAGVLAEHAVADTMRHAEVVGGLIRRCLEDAGVRPAALAGVVAGMGPGPFTGLRVGIAAARTFALAIDRPLLPVVSHDAIAAAAYAGGASGSMLVVTDARRRERYWSAYRGLDAAGLPERFDGPGLAKPVALPHTDLHRIDATAVSAGELGLVAKRTLAAGRGFAADTALYLRSPDVTMPAAPKRVTG